MSPGLFYRRPATYQLGMIGLYGRQYWSRYQMIADLITPNSTVLDLCCGPGTLYSSYLKHKSVTYTGFDLNARFISKLNAAGARGEVCDLRSRASFPEADYVVMQSSLYHFLPDPLPLLKLMYEAAGNLLIIAEPIRNVANVKLPFIRKMTGILTDAGTGLQCDRFTEESLDRLFERTCFQIASSYHVSHGKEKIFVIPKLV